jgi:hypothetical protein
MTAPKSIPTDLIDSLLAGYQKPEDLIGKNGLLKQLTKALVERALEAEMTEHLGHAKHNPVMNLNNTPGLLPLYEQGNCRKWRYRRVQGWPQLRAQVFFESFSSHRLSHTPRCGNPVDTKPGYKGKDLPMASRCSIDTASAA